MKLVTLDSVLTFHRGITFKPDDKVAVGSSDSVVCFRTKNIQKELDESDLLAVPSSFVKRDELYVNQGDILISTANSWELVGKCVRVAKTQYKSTIGGFISMLRPKTELIDPDYLYRFLSMEVTQERIRHLGKKTTNISNLDRVRFLQLEIPLPPLETQKQIAAVLEKADQLRKDCQQMEQELNGLAQSVFIDMFGDPVTNPKGWDIGTIGDLLLSANYGTSEKASIEKKKYPVLRMNNLTYEGNWDFSSLKYMDLSKDDEDKYLVESGDILFNRTNSKELVGKTAVYREATPMAYAGYLVRARCNELAHPDYIASFMNSSYTKQTLQSMCKSIVGMANINAKEFQKISIAKPPIELQQEFAKRVEAIRAEVEATKQQGHEYDYLFNALMQKAFKGELNL